MADAGPEPTYDEKLEYPPPPPWGSALEPVCMLLSLISYSRADPEMRGEGGQAFVERVLEGTPSP